MADPATPNCHVVDSCTKSENFPRGKFQKSPQIPPKSTILGPKMVYFLMKRYFFTYGWLVPLSWWFSVQFYLGQFELSRFLCGDFDFAIVTKNWHFFRVTLWYFFFYKIVVFLTLHQTRVRWVKRLENEFSGKWRALIGRFEKVRTWAWFGLATHAWCHFFFFSQQRRNIKKGKIIWTWIYFEKDSFCLFFDNLSKIVKFSEDVKNTKITKSWSFKWSRTRSRFRRWPLMVRTKFLEL